ncbi:hypothetical protein HMPREF9532_01320 [Escherichia coli MS 57-2]|nr:hypothetical protein HMPREF9532_01320 [Escherichia coli MS 57-2]ESD41453.1 hypothetical protein HMPREF1604_02318 [Escherichia coli 908519]
MPQTHPKKLNTDTAFPGAQANSPCFSSGLQTIPERRGGSR